MTSLLRVSSELVENVGQENLLESHRTEVSVVFCDLRGFTAFASEVGPEEVMGLLDEYYDAQGSIIMRYEATLTCFMGDGLMLLLNAPLPCPEPATRAVRMALLTSIPGVSQHHRLCLADRNAGARLPRSRPGRRPRRPVADRPTVRALDRSLIHSRRSRRRPPSALHAGPRRRSLQSRHEGEMRTPHRNRKSDPRNKPVPDPSVTQITAPPTTRRYKLKEIWRADKAAAVCARFETLFEAEKFSD
jgi:hypothetical protein